MHLVEGRSLGPGKPDQAGRPDGESGLLQVRQNCTGLPSLNRIGFDNPERQCRCQMSSLISLRALTSVYEAARPRPLGGA
jgi:hypothetical protein